MGCLYSRRRIPRILSSEPGRFIWTHRTFVRYQVPLKNGRKMAGAMAVNWPHSLGAEAARLDRLLPPSTEMSEDERAAALRKQENMRAFYDHLEGN